MLMGTFPPASDPLPPFHHSILASRLLRARLPLPAVVPARSTPPLLYCSVTFHPSASVYSSVLPLPPLVLSFSLSSLMNGVAGL